MYSEISCHSSVFSTEPDGLQSEQKDCVFLSFCSLIPHSHWLQNSILTSTVCLHVIEPQRTKTGNRLTDKTKRFPPSSCWDSYLEGVASEAESQLSTDHHGLHGSPAIAAHGPPHQRTVPLHQHLHAALVGVTTSAQTQLQAGKTQRRSKSLLQTQRMHCTVHLGSNLYTGYLHDGYLQNNVPCLLQRLFEPHRLLEAHGGNVTPHGCIFLMAATESLLVEEALCDGLLKPGALHLVHVHRAHTWNTDRNQTGWSAPVFPLPIETERKHLLYFFLSSSSTFLEDQYRSHVCTVIMRLQLAAD